MHTPFKSMLRISHDGCSCIFDKNEKFAHYKHQRIIYKQSPECFSKRKDDDDGDTDVEGTYSITV